MIASLKYGAILIAATMILIPPPAPAEGLNDRGLPTGMNSAVTSNPGANRTPGIGSAIPGSPPTNYPNDRNRISARNNAITNGVNERSGSLATNTATNASTDGRTPNSATINPNDRSRALQKVSENSAANSARTNTARTFTARGAALLKKGDVNAALGNFRQAVQTDSANAEILVEYALALMYAGQDEDAREQLVRATSLRSDSTSTWELLGQCCLSLGRSQDAVQAFRHAVALSPQSPAATEWRKLIATGEKELLDKRLDPMVSGATDYLHLTTRNGAVRWRADAMPLHVYIKPLTTSTRVNFDFHLRQALDEWSKSSNGLITFQITDDAANAQINCSWSEGLPSELQSNEGGDTNFHFSDNALQSVDITFLTKNARGWPVSDIYFRRVALHQIGHALGLREHSYDSNDIMFFRSRNTMSGLSERDKRTLIGLYTMDKQKRAEMAVAITAANAALASQPSQPVISRSRSIELSAATVVAPLAVQPLPLRSNARPEIASSKSMTLSTAPLTSATARSTSLPTSGGARAAQRSFSAPSRQPLSPALQQSLSAGTSQSLSAGASQSLSAGASQSLSAGTSQSLSAGASQSLSAGASQSLSAGAPQSLSAGAPQSLSAGAPQSLSAGAPQSLSAAALRSAVPTAAQQIAGHQSMPTAAQPSVPSTAQPHVPTTPQGPLSSTVQPSDPAAQHAFSTGAQRLVPTAGHRAVSNAAQQSLGTAAPLSLPAAPQRSVPTTPQRFTSPDDVKELAFLPPSAVHSSHPSVSGPQTRGSAIGNSSAPSSSNAVGSAAVSSMPPSSHIARSVVPTDQPTGEALEAMDEMNFPLGISLLEQAHRNGPTSPTSDSAMNLVRGYTRAANFNWSSGNFNQAAKYFQKGMAIARSCPDQSDCAELLSDYRKFCPAYAVSLGEQGVKLVQQDRFDEAIDKLKESISLDPNVPENLCNYGAALMHIGEIEGAISQFKKAIAIRPAYSSAWVQMATCYTRLGRSRDALAAFKKNLELDPSGPMAPTVKQEIAKLQRASQL